LAAVLYRAALQAHTAGQIAEMGITQAAVEQGRQALLHGELAEAQRELVEAYQRGDHSPGVAFMLARALQPRLAEQARFTSTSGRMWSASYSPDGTQIVTTDDKNAQVWDARTYRLLFTLAHDHVVHHAVYSDAGTRLVTAGYDVVKIWDAANGILLRELTRKQSGGKPRDYCIVALSPDGKLVTAIDATGEAADAWDTGTGAVLAELRNDGSEFTSLAFSADGRWLVSSGGDEVHVVDTATWKVACTLAAHHVRSLSFDPAGPHLATGSSDGDASIWDIPSGVRTRHLRDRRASRQGRVLAERQVVDDGSPRRYGAGVGCEFGETAEPV